MLKVLYVASEAVPFVKTGGLADVAGSLPKALKKQGVDVRVVLPIRNISIATAFTATATTRNGSRFSVVRYWNSCRKWISGPTSSTRTTGTPLS